MSITRMSARAFNQGTSLAKKAAHHGPVIITDRGRPAYVLLTIEQYNQREGDQLNMADLLSQKDGEYFDFEPPRLEGPLFKSADID